MKLEQAARQALEALEALKHEGNLRCIDDLAALANLREALAKQAEQEPVAWVGEFAKPTAEYLEGTPLYATPVRTKDLTGDEIKKLQHKIDWTAEWSYVTFARAVIAAYKEKNRG